MKVAVSEAFMLPRDRLITLRDNRNHRNTQLLPNQVIVDALDHHMYLHGASSRLS